MRSPTRIAAASTLTCEALVVIFAGLVAKDLSSLSLAAVLGISGGLAVACLLVAGLLRYRAGYIAGSVLQVLVIGYGIWLPTMLLVGAIFAALWVMALVMGTRAEREHRRRWPEAGSGSGIATGPDARSS